MRIPTGVRLDLGATAKALGRRPLRRSGAQATGAAVWSPGWRHRAPPARRQGTAGGSTSPTTTAALPTTPGQTISIDAGGLATSSTTVRRWSCGAERCTTSSTRHRRARHGDVADRQRRGADCVDANIASTAALSARLAGLARGWGWLRAVGTTAQRLAAGPGASSRSRLAVRRPAARGPLGRARDDAPSTRAPTGT